MKISLCSFLLLISVFPVRAASQDSLKAEKKVKGLDINILPSVTYNPDRGLQIGVVTSLYDYTDSVRYPDYLYNVYAFFAQNARKRYSYRVFFDSKHLLSDKIRLIVNMSYITNRFEQFYGFNGYNSDYQRSYEDPSKKDYISKHYYFYHKSTFALFVDLQGKLPLPHVWYDAGVSHYNTRIQPFYHYGAPGAQQTLFEKYIENEVIPSHDKNGGVATYLKAGIIYDTRDDESIPTKGFWIEGIYCYAPSFFGNSESYSQAVLIYRQYIKVFPSLVFAYRLAYQGLLKGDMPFYMMPYLLSTYWTDNALGGAKTIRGVRNERLQGNGYAMANLEFRYFMFRTFLLGRNLDIALNAFSDMGRVTQLCKIPPTVNYSAIDYRLNQEQLHYSLGAGIRFIINHNFITSLDCGQPLSPKDGTTAFYFDLDYLF